MAAASAGGSLVPVCGQYTGIGPRQQKAIVEILFGGKLPMLTIIPKKGGKPTEKQAETARVVFEAPGTAEQQCKYVIGQKLRDKTISQSEKDSYTNCWLCGLSLEAFEKQLGGSVCEHVLPIIQAVMYIGLFNKEYFESLPASSSAAATLPVANSLTETYIAPETKESYLKSLYNEYRYAHAQCNALKGEILFVTTTADGKFAIDDSNIIDLLGKILLEIKKQNIKLFNNDGKFFITNRTQAIRDIMNPIITRMNASFTDEHERIVNAPNLTQLAAAAALISYPRLGIVSPSTPLITAAPAPKINKEEITKNIIKNVTTVYKLLLNDKLIHTNNLTTRIASHISTLSLPASIQTALAELNKNDSTIRINLDRQLDDTLAGKSPTYFELFEIISNLTNNLIHNVFKRAQTLYNTPSTRSMRNSKKPLNTNTLDTLKTDLAEKYPYLAAGVLLSSAADAIEVASADTVCSLLSSSDSTLPVAASTTVPAGATGGGSAIPATNFTGFPPTVSGARNVIRIYDIKNPFDLTKKLVISRRTELGEGVPGTVGQAAYALATISQINETWGTEVLSRLRTTASEAPASNVESAGPRPSKTRRIESLPTEKNTANTLLRLFEEATFHEGKRGGGRKITRKRRRSSTIRRRRTSKWQARAQS